MEKEMTLREHANYLFDEFKKVHNGELPTRVEVDVVWKDDPDRRMYDIVSLKEYDIDTKDDNDILFYFGGFDEMMRGVVNDGEDISKAEGEFAIVDVFSFY